MDTKIRTRVNITRRHSVDLTAENIREAFGLPSTARVSFHVPGGGDWAHADIDIEADTPIHVEWEEVSEEGGLE